MKKILKWTGIVLGGLLVLSVLAGLILYPIGMKKLTRTYPNITVETVNIPTDAEAIAHGEHVSVIWACTKCHGEDLSGMLITNDPISNSIPLYGVVPASNLTSGLGGVGPRYTDDDWIRAIRQGVKPNGQVEIFMNDFSILSDQDLGDLIAYLKQVPPVDVSSAAMRYGPILPILPALGMFTPAAELIDHSAQRLPDSMPGETVEYGKYLSSICTGCHGSRVGNAVKQWTREEFIRAFNDGVLSDGKPLAPMMSSETFRELNDMELSALWLYFADAKP